MCIRDRFTSTRTSFRLQWNHSHIVVQTNPIGWMWSSISDPCYFALKWLTLHFTIILRLTSGRKYEREKIIWQWFQQYLEHVLKMSSVNSFLTAKFDKCFFSRKVSNAQKKVWGKLKAEFMKWLFRFGIIKLRPQLILGYEQQFKTWDKLLFTLPKSNFYTSRTLKICQFH